MFCANCVYNKHSLKNAKLMDKALLMHKVIAGTASKEEKAALDDWLAADQANREDYYDMIMLYSDPGHFEGETGPSPDTGWPRFEAAMARANRRKKFWKRLGKFTLAAGLYLAVLLAYDARPVSGRRDAAPDRLAANTHFEEASIGEVLRVIEESGSLKVSLENAGIAACRFTGSFSRGTSYAVVLEVIAAATDLTVSVRTDNTLLLSGDGCVR